MTRCLVLKHTRSEKNGTTKYRRRVPQKLQTVLGKSEIVKVLGRTESEVLANYQPFHEHVEQLFRSATLGSEAVSLTEVKAQMEALLSENNFDPYSPGRTEMERHARSEEAARILNKYHTNPETGLPDPEDVSAVDDAKVSALITGVHTIEAELSITEAFTFYLAEKNEPDPFKRKKQLQRFSRAQTNLLNVTRDDISLSKVTRAHARKVRDNLSERMVVTSVRRNINDLKAVFSLAIREHDLSINNPFARLDFAKPADAAIDLRHPLPSDIVRSMYLELQGNQTLFDIWTLIHHTGAQSAEILGLLTSDLHLDHPVPHFEIKPQGQRTVKDRSRIRKVPLVGQALVVASRLAKTTRNGEALFPSYAATNRHDAFSQAVRTRLRKHTTDRKHTIYSLRHLMKDALRNAEVGERVELALLGHSNERTSSAQYGSGVGLEALHQALLSIEFDFPAECDAVALGDVTG